jgi:nucleotidyltransferase/DNA polymerase involved in DNA repair
MLPRRVIPFIHRGSSERQSADRPEVVFQIGRDQELLRLRAKIISHAGYTVQSMTPERVHAEIRETGGPRVWVFCHTLDFYELALSAVAIRNSRPEDKLLRLASLNDTDQAPGLFDELLEPVMGVDELLRVVGALARRPSVRKTV